MENATKLVNGTDKLLDMPAMTKKAAITLILLTTCSLQSVVYGQERTRRRGGAETIPEIGSLIPELSVFDAEGNRFALRKKLEGRHAVIVFGCLT